MDLLQPEIVSKVELIGLLREKCPSLGDLSSLEHPGLLDLFYKNIAPLPQRKYRLNRRGREMTKLQIVADKRKRRYDQISSSTTDNNSSVQQNSSGSQTISSFQSSASGERLKPPPSAINKDRKVIKLGKNTASTSSISINSGPVKCKNELSSSISNMNTQTTNISVSTPGNKSDNGVTETNHTNIMPTNTAVIKPNSSTSTNAKIKLKRPGVIVVSDAADGDRIPVSPPADNKVHSDVDMKEAHSTENKSAASRQLAMINKTLGDGNIHNTPSNVSRENSDESPTSPTEEGVMRKKFKRVAVKWP